MPLRAQIAKGPREAGAAWVRGMAQAQDKSRGIRGALATVAAWNGESVRCRVHGARATAAP